VALGIVVVNDRFGFVHTPVDGPQLIALLAGTAAAAGLGALDDYFDLRARYQLVTQLGWRSAPSPSGSRSDSSTTRSAPTTSPLPAVRGGLHRAVDRGDDQQHELHRRPRRAVERDRIIAALTLA